jgi:glutamine transport system substrate-binding protein
MKRHTLIALGLASLLHLGPIGSAHAQNAELVVGSTVSGPPFSFRDADSYSGFDIELWDQVAKAIGRRYRIQPMEFAGLIPALQTRNMDVVTAQLFIRPERQQIIDFSEPYYESGLIAAVKIDNAGINKPADLAGKVIGTETGTVAVNFIKTSIQNAKLEQLSDINAVLLALEAGRVEAVVYDAPKLALYAE